MTLRSRRRWPEVLLTLLSVAICLGTIEVALQLYASWGRQKVAAARRAQQPEEPLHIVLDSPVVYGLNPAHADVSSQGLRNSEVVVPKPDNRWRLLVLGDSVTWGTGVERAQAFPAQLEGLLTDPHKPAVEVINAGVSGYSTWNQLQYYKTQGRTLQPDVVLVGLCLNDVANPRYHWDNTGGFLTDIPEGAIPNIEYAAKKRREREGRRFILGSLIRERLGSVLGDRARAASVPTFLTGEDPDLRIEVLMDRRTPERQWLERMYTELQAAVEADGARFMVVLFPKHYQLDANYPHIPQTSLVAFFAARGIPALDLLPVFREAANEGLFLENGGIVDPWHLSVHGHQRTAQWLADWIRSQPGNFSPPSEATEASRVRSPQPHKSREL